MKKLEQKDIDSISSIFGGYSGAMASTYSSYSPSSVFGASRTGGWNGPINSGNGSIGGIGYGGRSNSSSSGSSSGSSSSRVICTHFYRKGMLDQIIWRADIEFTSKRLSRTTVRGYHLWAIPYVRLMRRSVIAEKIMYPLAKWRAEELAYQMGISEICNWKGKLVRILGESICFSIGVFCKEQDWESLWKKDSLMNI